MVQFAANVNQERSIKRDQSGVSLELKIRHEMLKFERFATLGASSMILNFLKKTWRKALWVSISFERR